MKTQSYLRAMALFIGSLLVALTIARPAPLAAQSVQSVQSAQSTGHVEFTALVAPTGGRPEPVRQLTFYLLRKSMENIRAEALQMAPAPDLDKFIDRLDVSAELKAWMKKHHSVRLAGGDFTKGLTPEEILNIPEFFKAYMAHNAAYRGAGFPEPIYKEKERTTKPEKYKAQKDQYEAAIRKFITAAPDSVKGMDLEMIDLNPFPKWASLAAKQNQLLDSRTFQMAQERYLASRADTDLDGNGSFASVVAGNYWISMLGGEAIAGDVRLHWDIPVTVRRGETTRVELSNLNATSPAIESQNSTN